MQFIYKDNKQIIVEIKKLMLDCNISQRDLAKQLNITPQGLTKLFNKKNFSFEDAQKILQCFNYSLIVEFSADTVTD
jgi:Helix-turn-helix.